MPLDIDRYAHVSSPIQRWDPRFKIGALGLLILGIALVKTLPVSVLALALSIVLVVLSGLPFGFIGHGLSFVTIFLVPFFIIMPMTYPGEAAMHVLGLPFAWEGLRLATLIFLKAISIVLCSFVCFGTSRFDISMIALQHLKCPKVIVQMLLFTYRYTFVFLEEMRRMQTSMRARGFIPRTDGYTLRTYGNFVGTLLVRSFERTERVFKAMLSKGYQGEFHTLVTFSSDATDFIKSLATLILMVALLALDFGGYFHQAVKAWY
ncbi:MAG: cobalt ECF transporter T component CbiQ [Gammaproteobacteria bacterium]|nr:cobalt ECF transporter T component CbiQ [Gammaproteobacteria bacterium]